MGKPGMKILLTGVQGFIGRNLLAQLRNEGYEDIYSFDKDSDAGLLAEYTKDCGFVYHLAGVNRPEKTDEFMEGNAGFTERLLDALRENNNKAPVLLSSSIQAELSNPYGESKRAAEELVRNRAGENGNKTLIYRLPNVFGKWCRPNYNSAVATFCHQAANGAPLTVRDPEATVTLAYIDDVVEEFIRALDGKETRQGDFCTVEPVYEMKLSKISELLLAFRESRGTLRVPNLADDFEKKLYSTYLSYLPESRLSYPLRMNTDYRGSFTEIIRTPERGQFSVNIAKPGVTKGNHWHQSKNEKFVVVSGQGLIRLRKIDGTEVLEYRVGGGKIEAVDIPPGYTHSIANIGETDLITFMWVSEPFDPDRPDTYFMQV